MGSPPLAREQLNQIARVRFRARITPARAGTTLYAPDLIPPSADHPRSRGNNSLSVLIASYIFGSPPLAREQPKRVVLRRGESGITPARAGTTILSRNPCACIGDHPRSRGNNSSGALLSPDIRGSPPLAREQRSRKWNPMR